MGESLSPRRVGVRILSLRLPAIGFLPFFGWRGTPKAPYRMSRPYLRVVTSLRPWRRAGVQVHTFLHDGGAVLVDCPGAHPRRTVAVRRPVSRSGGFAQRLHQPHHRLYPALAC